MKSYEVHAGRTPNEIKGMEIRSNGIRQASFWMIKVADYQSWTAAAKPWQAMALATF